MRRLRVSRVIIFSLGVFLFILFLMVLGNLLFSLIGPKDQYTDKFLRELSQKELVVTTIEEVKGDKKIERKGILYKGELKEPKTNEDKKVLEIIRIANNEYRSIPMQLKYREVDEEKIIEKVKIINEKFTNKNIFIGVTEEKNLKGNKEQEKRIYSYPKNYVPNDLRITN